MTPTPRRLDVQGLRGVAVLAVIIHHAGLPLSGGFIGVDVFFVISGYVITESLRRELETTGRIRLLRFYWRRFTRLVPALATALTVTVAASLLLLSPFAQQRIASQTGVGAIFLVANEIVRRNGVTYFGPSAEANPLLHTWSLSVEEQFYLAFPALLLITWIAFRRARRHALVAVVASVLLLSLATVTLPRSITSLMPWQLEHVVGLAGNFYSPVGRAWEFAAGAVVALLHKSPTGRSVRGSAFVGLAGAGAVVAGLLLVSEATAWPGVTTLVPVVGTALVIWAGGVPSGGPITTLLGRSALTRIGDCSYSLYLWHWPFIVWAHVVWPGSTVATTAAAALAVIPAVAAYRRIETPLRRWDPPTRFAGLRFAAAVLLPPLALAGGVHVATTNRWWPPAVARVAREIEPVHAARASGCVSGRPLSHLRRHQCVWNEYASGTPVYLVGDSLADQWSEAVIASGQASGRPVYIAAGQSCPFMTAPPIALRPIRPGQNEACQASTEQSLKDLAHSRPGLVVVANSDRYWYEDHYALVGEQPGRTTGAAARTHHLQRSMTSTIAQLRSKGHHVLLLQATPQWVGSHEWDPAQCPTVKLLMSQCASSMSTAEGLRVQGPARAALDAASTAGGGSTWDPWTALCPAGECRTHTRSQIQYRDSGHITADTSRALTPQLAHAIRSASGERP